MKNNPGQSEPIEIAGPFRTADQNNSIRVTFTQVHSSMQRKRLVLFASLLAATTLAVSQSTPAFWSSSTTSSDDALHEEMEKLGASMKKLRRAIRNPEKNVSSLETLHKFQVAAVNTKIMIPAKPEDVKMTKAEWAKGYRMGMIKTIQKSLEMEIALLNGDQEGAQATYKELGQIKKKGHTTYQVDE